MLSYFLFVSKLLVILLIWQIKEEEKEEKKEDVAHVFYIRT